MRWFEAECDKFWDIILNSARDAIVLADEDGIVRYWNKSAEEMFGFKKEEVIGEYIWDVIIPEEYVSRIVEGFRRFKEGKGGRVIGKVIEVEAKKKDGSRIPVELSLSAASLDKKYAIAIIRDLSEKIKLKSELEEVKELYQLIVENMKDIVFLIDKRGVVRYISPSIERVAGYNAEEIIGKHYLTFVHPNERKKFKDLFERMLEGTYEFRIISKDRKPKYLRSVSKLIYKDGDFVGITGVIQDISDKKELETELREREALFEALTEKSLVGIYLLQDGVLKYVNPKFAEIIGYEVDEIVGRSPLDFIHPEDKPIVERNIELRLTGAIDAVKYKFRILKKNGEVKVVEAYGSRILYKGKPAIIGTLIDRTDEELTKKELEKYRRFYENAQDLLFILDKDGKFIDVNPRFAEMLGFSKEELVGKAAEVLTDQRGSKLIDENFKRVLRGGSAKYEIETVSRNGKKYTVEITVWPIIENGEVVGAEGIARDVTKSKELEKEIKEKEEKYRKIFESSPTLMAIVDENSIFVETNPKIIESLGYNPIGKSFREVFPPDVAEKGLNWLKIVFQHDKVITFEYRRKDKYFLVTLVPMKLSEKRYCLIIANELTKIVKFSKLLSTVNKISKIIVHERDKNRLLQMACEELANLEDYYSAWLGLLGEGCVKVIAKSKLEVYVPGYEINLRTLPENNCIKSVVESKKINIREPRKCDDCKGCFLRPARSELICITVPMILDNSVIGIIKVLSDAGKPLEEELEILQSLANDLAFAIKSFEVEKERRRAYMQIEKNIEQFAYLVDRIRNPLAAIIGYAEMSEKVGDVFKKIIQHAKRIDEILEEIDKVWRESERVKKH